MSEGAVLDETKVENAARRAQRRRRVNMVEDRGEGRRGKELLRDTIDDEGRELYF